MKKILVLLLIVSIPLLSFAQGWSRTDYPADELKGNKAYTAYTYQLQDLGAFIFFSSEDGQYRITCTDGIFGVERINGYVGQQITVGIYDDNDKLVDKFKMWLDALDGTNYDVLTTRNAGTMSNPMGQKGKVKKILKCIIGGSGYVRFLAPRHNKTDFDFKVYPIDIAM